MTGAPFWIRNVSHLPLPDRLQRTRRWLRQGLGQPPRIRPWTDQVRRQAALLADAVEEARVAGASWQEIARSIGIDAASLRKIVDSTT